MSFRYCEIWQHMGVPAMIVAGVLVIMGLASLTVFVERIITLRRSRAASRPFAGAVGADVDGGDDRRRHRASARASIQARPLRASCARPADLPARARNRRHLRPHAGRAHAPSPRALHGGDRRRPAARLRVLASVGRSRRSSVCSARCSASSRAFQGIAATGSGGLSSVSAGIREALVETALGLAVAIPAVLAFNYLSNVIAARRAAAAPLRRRAARHDRGLGRARAANVRRRPPARLEPARGGSARVSGASVGRRSPDSGVRPDINVTPLVDVVLVLLIIFMVVSAAHGPGRAGRPARHLQPRPRGRRRRAAQGPRDEGGRVLHREQKLRPRRR